jgi:hypothetical protein
MLNFTSQEFTIEAGDGADRRTISGIAIPYGVEATVSDGTRVKVLAGALPTDGKNPKFFLTMTQLRPSVQLCQGLKPAMVQECCSKQKLLEQTLVMRQCFWLPKVS